MKKWAGWVGQYGQTSIASSQAILSLCYDYVCGVVKGGPRLGLKLYFTVLD